MMRRIWILAPLFSPLCHAEDISVSELDTQAQVTINTEFNDGENGWVAGFSDYPIAHKDIYQLVSGIQPIPGNPQKTGFLLGGMNRSDDLFMYLKKQVSGLKPNTRYAMTADVTFWSESGDMCFGVGGSPGSAVFVKVGASDIEPQQADYYMNIDIGHQSNSGNDAQVVGNVTVQGVDCYGGEFKSKQLALSNQMTFEASSSAEGDLWLILGSDSGYEGLTHLYYESISVTLTPMP